MIPKYFSVTNENKGVLMLSFIKIKHFFSTELTHKIFYRNYQKLLIQHNL